jgi:Family of unknown function (DUF5989)
MEQDDSTRGSDFARHATEKRSSFLSDYLYLVKTNRKWWMLPLLALLFGFGLLMVLSSTGAAPFIYTLF